MRGKAAFAGKNMLLRLAPEALIEARELVGVGNLYDQGARMREKAWLPDGPAMRRRKNRVSGREPRSKGRR